MVTPVGSAAPAPLPLSAVTEDRVRAILEGVHDPEIPTVSIVDLGLIHAIEVADDRITVELLPTFVACPALDVIRAAVGDSLAAIDRPVQVDFTFEVPWTTDRLTARGRAGLAAAGIAPPADVADVRCPYCGSDHVAMNSAFGPTLCRSLWYCRDCRQPFEGFKTI
jgi:ring-1,2-phenylacetyl-CoA epoxidase subunit PaaD